MVDPNLYSSTLSSSSSVTSTSATSSENISGDASGFSLETGVAQKTDPLNNNQYNAIFKALEGQENFEFSNLNELRDKLLALTDVDVPSEIEVDSEMVATEMSGSIAEYADAFVAKFTEENFLKPIAKQVIKDAQKWESRRKQSAAAAARA